MDMDIEMKIHIILNYTTDFYGAFLPQEFQIATYSIMAKDSSTRSQKKGVSVRM